MKSKEIYIFDAKLFDKRSSEFIWYKFELHINLERDRIDKSDLYFQ